MTRRALFGVVGLGVPSVLLAGRADAQPTQNDTVLEAIVNEMAALQKRLEADPRNPEYARELAGLFRVTNLVMDAHDLKRRLRHVRRQEITPATAASLASRMRDHGIGTTGDDLLKRHFEHRAQFVHPEAIDQYAESLLRSGAIFLETATALDAVAGPERAVSPIMFRESLRGPASPMFQRKVMPNLCSWASQYGGRWATLLGATGLMFSLVPPLEPLAIAYGIAAFGFDFWASMCDQS